MNLEEADRSTFEGFRIAGFSECLATFAATKSEVLHGLESWNQIDKRFRSKSFLAACPLLHHPKRSLGLEIALYYGEKDGYIRHQKIDRVNDQSYNPNNGRET